MKFKKGERVKVVDNKYKHGFKIGDIVTITSVFDEVYTANGNNSHGSWLITDEELKAL